MEIYNTDEFLYQRIVDTIESYKHQTKEIDKITGATDIFNELQMQLGVKLNEGENITGASSGVTVENPNKNKSDIQKLKSVFDDIGVKYEEEVEYQESGKRELPAKLIESCRNIRLETDATIFFRFIDGKFYHLYEY